MATKHRDTSVQVGVQHQMNDADNAFCGKSLNGGERLYTWRKSPSPYAITLSLGEGQEGIRLHRLQGLGASRLGCEDIPPIGATRYHAFGSLHGVIRRLDAIGRATLL